VASAEGNHDRAVTLLRQAFVLEPTTATSNFDLGLALMRAGRPADAIDRLQTAAALSEDPLVHRHLADAYVALGQADEARKAQADYDRLRREAVRRRGARR
jgi:predicted Zn-dependent protease